MRENSQENKKLFEEVKNFYNPFKKSDILNTTSLLYTCNFVF